MSLSLSSSRLTPKFSAKQDNWKTLDDTRKAKDEIKPGTQLNVPVMGAPNQNYTVTGQVTEQNTGTDQPSLEIPVKPGQLNDDQNTVLYVNPSRANKIKYQA